MGENELVEALATLEEATKVLTRIQQELKEKHPGEIILRKELCRLLKVEQNLMPHLDNMDEKTKSQAVREIGEMKESALKAIKKLNPRIKTMTQAINLTITIGDVTFHPEEEKPEGKKREASLPLSSQNSLPGPKSHRSEGQQSASLRQMLSQGAGYFLRSAAHAKEKLTSPKKARIPRIRRFSKPDPSGNGTPIPPRKNKNKRDL